MARSLSTASAPWSPQRASDVHAVLDQMPAGAFDHAGGDRPAAGEGGGVIQVSALVEQVVGADVGVVALGLIEAQARCLAPDRGGHDAGLALEDRAALLRHPALGRWVSFAERSTTLPTTNIRI